MFVTITQNFTLAFLHLFHLMLGEQGEETKFYNSGSFLMSILSSKHIFYVKIKFGGNMTW